jgi:hypothetical protein
VTLEEEIIELRGRLQFSTEKTEDMKRLMELVIGEEQSIKAKASRQVLKVRVDIEAEHAAELRSLREAYQKEKQLLVEQLERIGSAVADAKLDIDPTEWRHQLEKTEIENKFKAEAAYQARRNRRDKLAAVGGGDLDR